MNCHPVYDEARDLESTISMLLSRSVACQNQLVKTHSRKFTVVIERDEEGNLVATVPALRGCHTQAKNLDTLMKRVREVVQVCLEDNHGVPSLELVGIQQISV